MVGIGKVGSGVRRDDRLPLPALALHWVSPSVGVRFEVSLLRTPLLRPELEPVLSFWECP